MFRALPWAVAAICLVGFGASFSELERMRARFGEVTRHEFHDHAAVREFMIRAALDGLDQPIVVIGDSIVEMARFPEMIGDKPVVNAGIGGATIKQFAGLVPTVLQEARPSLVVIALGTNDTGSATIQQDYAALLFQLKKISPRLLAVAVANSQTNAQVKVAAESEGVRFVEMPEVARMTDGIHLSAAGYREWTPSIVAAISR